MGECLQLVVSGGCRRTYGGACSSGEVKRRGVALRTGRCDGCLSSFLAQELPLHFEVWVLLEAWTADTVLGRPWACCVSLTGIEARPESRHIIQQRIVLLVVLCMIASARAAFVAAGADAALFEVVAIRE